jgi:hypothetical protein
MFDVLVSLPAWLVMVSVFGFAAYFFAAEFKTGQRTPRVAMALLAGLATTLGLWVVVSAFVGFLV